MIDPVQGRPAAVQHHRSLDLRYDLAVHRQQKIAVGLATHQVAGRMIGQGHDVRPSFDLSVGEHDRDLLQTLQAGVHLVRLQQDVNQELLHPEHVVGERPRPHYLADHTSLRVTPPQFLYRVQNCLRCRPIQEVIRNLNLPRTRPARRLLAGRHPRSGHHPPFIHHPRVLPPVDLRPQRRRPRDQPEVRHHRVEAQLRIAQLRQTHHRVGVEVRLRKREPGPAHLPVGRRRHDVANRPPIDLPTDQRRQHSFSRFHDLPLCLTH